MSAMPRRQFLRTAVGMPLLPLFGCTTKPEAEPPPDPTLPLLTGTSGDSINAFACDLYAKLATDQKNHFVSPYSISTALAMTAAGANGATREQMAKVLHLPEDVTAGDGVYRALAAAVTGKGKPYSLSVANAIFAQTGYPWAESFKARVTETFKAGLVDADFIKDPEKERLAINAWVEKQTNDRIKELLKEGIITRLTRMVLTNAIYFKGDWATAFKKDQTRYQPFANLDGTKNDAPIMRKTGADVFWNKDLQMIRLMYKGNDLSFLAILPNKAEDFAKVEKSLSKEALATWCKDLHASKDMDVWLPRFSIETYYALVKPLHAMGMVDAFDGNANFDGMVSTPPAGLFISAVEHKAFVDVNEEGTEAAAATAVSLAKDSKPLGFRADRPFLFAIRHEASGALLFLGRVAKL